MRTDTWTSATNVSWHDSLVVRETPPEHVFLRPRLYLETTIPSYLTARSSRDMNRARNQRITSRWWNSWRTNFQIYISDLVVREASAGDSAAARRRLELIVPYRLAESDARSQALADRLIGDCSLPKGAETDARHVAVAAIHSMQYLLTWNCAHLADAEVAPRMAAACSSAGYECPVICTPIELLERYERGPTE